MDRIKFGVKYLAALISATLAANSSSNEYKENFGDIDIDSESPIQATVLNQFTPLELAAHRSHSSHRSHRSHSSHRSSSGGGYRAPAPAYTPPAPARQTSPARQESERQSGSNNSKESQQTTNATRALDSNNHSMAKSDKYDLAAVIKRIQLALTFEGYYNGSIDGIMGPATRKSITSYRKDKGLGEQGYIDAALLNSLGILVQ